jgi:hypothetical protein
MTARVRSSRSPARCRSYACHTRDSPSTPPALYAPAATGVTSVSPASSRTGPSVSARPARIRVIPVASVSAVIDHEPLQASWTPHTDDGSSRSATARYGENWCPVTPCALPISNRPRGRSVTVSVNSCAHCPERYVSRAPDGVGTQKPADPSRSTETSRPAVSTAQRSMTSVPGTTR